MALHKSRPDIPVMGTDVVREHGTGKLFLLEFNSRGRTWHLSSEHGKDHQRDFQLDYYHQFDALSSIADALIEVTRRRAVNINVFTVASGLVRAPHFRLSWRKEAMRAGFLS